MRASRLRVGYRKALKHFNLLDRKYVKDKEEKRKLLGIYRKTRVLCSCTMCGNPRRFFGNGKLSKTLRETKQDITEKEELDLLGGN